ncbi:MAG: DUF92 domain-containing protein [Thermoanaerobaculia bacterium]|jgi:uncharacterized protein (TIGR00297 family)
MTDIDSRATNQGYSEIRRKAVHIGLGFIAFSLGVLPWTIAAGCAFAAIVFNLLILPRMGGGAIARSERGTDLGIVLYPLSVFLLIVTFRHEPLIAAVGWIALAFGDGMATVIGRNLGGPRVPWNRQKGVLGSLGFFEVALPVAWVATRVIESSETLIPKLMTVFVAIGVAMIVESLDSGIDDNLTVPFAAALSTWALMTVTKLPATLSPQQKSWLVVNCVLAVVGFAARTVNWSGFIGGAALGSAIIVFGGWQLYLVLLLFFILGSATTKLGMRRKAKMGLAQEGGGRRGFFHAFANVGTATILAFLAATTKLDSPALWLAAVASLATAAADTTASEIGQLIGRNPFMPLTFKRVEPGTEGAISIEGTLAGAVAALGVAIFGTVAWVSWYTGDTYLPTALRIAVSPEKLTSTAKLIVMITASAVVASWIESVVGSWNRSRSKKISNGTLNFMNTAVGAALLLALVKLSS